MYWDLINVLGLVHRLHLFAGQFLQVILYLFSAETSHYFAPFGMLHAQVRLQFSG
jgi:hypothetical protein